MTNSTSTPDPLLEDFAQVPESWATQVPDEIAQGLRPTGAEASSVPALARRAQRAFQRYLQATHQAQFVDAGKELAIVNEALDHLAQLTSNE